MGKQHKDRFQTYCWNRRIIKDPYQVIAEIFFLDDLEGFREHIKRFLLLSVKEVKLKRKDLSDLFFKLRAIKSLIFATECLVKTGQCIGSERLYSFRGELRCTFTILKDDEWENPYKAFKRFFKSSSATKWGLLLDDILDYAVSSYKANPEYDLLPIFLLLTALIEASSLINTWMNPPTIDISEPEEMEKKIFNHHKYFSKWKTQ